MAEGKVKVAVLDDYQEYSRSLVDWSAVSGRISYDVFTDTLLDEDPLVKRLYPYEIICAMRERTKFPASLLDKLPNLKFIATTGGGNRGIDIVYAQKKGVVVSGTGGAGNSTLEHIWALILSSARYIVVEHNGVRDDRPQWQTKIPVGLAGKTLGLVGVGNLGSRTGQIAKAFDMKVVGWSPNLTPEKAEAAGVTFIETKEELFQRSDIVSIHMVLSERTRHMITAEDFALLKPSAIFINTSRGPLVDETALVEALKAKKFAHAGLDVFDIEPLPEGHALRGLDNVTLSPHMGYVSDDNYAVFWRQTVENILSYLNGSPQRVITR